MVTRQFVKMLMVVLAILIVSPVVLAGVTNPLPSLIEILPGNSERFKFQIQALSSDSILTCNYAFETEPKFEVAFDDEEFIIGPKSKANFYGTVTAPQELPPGHYETTFCISCTPEKQASGAAVQINTCGIPLKLDIVTVRTRDNLYVPEKEAEGISALVIILGAVALAVILLLIGLYIFLRKRSIKFVIIKKPVKKK